MGYERDDRRYPRGDDYGARGHRNEHGRNYDRGFARDERPRQSDDHEGGFIDRAADEVRSWFGDDEAERRRDFDDREAERQDRHHRPLSSSGSNRSPEGSRGRDTGFGGFGGGAPRGGYGNYDARRRDQSQNPSVHGYGNWGAGSGRHDHDPHYRSWRDRQVEALDREYDDYHRERQSRFESDYGSWRQQREAQRGLVANIREHAEVESSDGQHVGTVDKLRGDRVILTKGDGEAGGRHHWIPASWVQSVDDGKVRLSKSHDDARRHWRDAEEEGGDGPHILNRSFSGTY